MADAAVSFLLESLRDLLAERIDSIRGVEGELQQLQKLLQQLLRSFLVEQQKKGKELKQFDREIRDLVYKAEDVIDPFVTQAEAKTSIHFLLKNRNPRFDRFLPEILKTHPVSCARFSRRRLEEDLLSVTEDIRGVLKQVPETELQELVHLHLQTDGVGNSLKQATPAAGQLLEIDELQVLVHLRQTHGISIVLKRATPAAKGHLPEIKLQELEDLHLQTHSIRDALIQASPAKSDQLPEIKLQELEDLDLPTHGIRDALIQASPAKSDQLPEIKLQELDDLHLQTHGIRNPFIASLAAGDQLPEIKLQEIPGLERNNVVGFEDELETLVGYLNQESKKLDVISIIGDYGSGKTTLASMIYKDPRIKSSFPTLWVNGSQEFSTKSLFLAITNGSDQKTTAQLPDSMQAEIVRHFLDEKKFLMIIDGIHTTQDWMAIEATLPKANGVGKVVVTTHDEKLACRANPKGNTLRLRPLNRDESWKLFQLKVFGKLGECPPDLEMMGKDIANKCEGSPFAIVTMAGELGGTRKIGEWGNISKSVDKYLGGKDREERHMRNSIALSCDKLPYYLWDCFFYLGMFPEGTEIPVWKLAHLWIAEGFIKRNPRKSLEEAVEDYLEDLIDRNLVMVDKTKVGGGVKTCRISKMVREFICRTQAEVSAEENVFQEVHDVKKKVTSRRLCVHSNVVDFLRKKPDGAKVRSFLCFSKESTELPPECTESVPQAFSLLRILDASPINFLKFPRKLAQLIHLRYIAISGDEFNSLPQFVSNHWNLQTIIITTASDTLKIKANIWKMMRLRHLKTKAAIVISKVAKGRAGENLQTLTRLAAQCVTEDFCSRASNLKILGIRGNLNTLSERNCLAKLDRLQKLKLVHNGYALSRLPPGEAFPPNLMILELSSTYLDWDHMDTLALLPTLEVLKLKENAFVGRYWMAEYISFPYLEVLLIASTDLQTWTASSYSFPKLRSLVLKNCKSLDEIPHNLVKTLKVLDFDGCTESLAHSAQRMKEQHLPRDGFKLTILNEPESLSHKYSLSHRCHIN